MVAASSPSTNSLLIRRLYRSLIKVSRPFDGIGSSSKSQYNATALKCLIYRNGMEDLKWEDFLRNVDTTTRDDDNNDQEKNNKDVDSSLPTPPDNHQLFRKLLRQLVGGDPVTGIRQMQFPSHITTSRSTTTTTTTTTTRLGDLIRREFQCPDRRHKDDSSSKAVEKASDDDEAISGSYSLETRREVAFMALRELNKKLVWAKRLQKKAQPPHPHQAARFVSPLPLLPSSAYLQPGTYLIAHPHLTDYFRRTVICILEHHDHDQDTTNTGGSSSTAAGSFVGTYGLIVNRICTSPDSGKNMTLPEIIRPVPHDLAEAFGASVVKEGGPVHMSLQMLHAGNPDDDISEDNDINEDDINDGGNDNNDSSTTTATTRLHHPLEALSCPWPAPATTTPRCPRPLTRTAPSISKAMSRPPPKPSGRVDWIAKMFPFLLAPVAGRWVNWKAKWNGGTGCPVAGRPKFV